MIFMRYRVMAEKPPKNGPRANVAIGNMSENPTCAFCVDVENGILTPKLALYFTRPYSSRRIKSL